jgi:hypothetical protein
MIQLMTVKDKIHAITSINVKEGFDKIQHSFMIEDPKLGI